MALRGRIPLPAHEGAPNHTQLMNTVVNEFEANCDEYLSATSARDCNPQSRKDLDGGVMQQMAKFRQGKQ